MQISAAVLILHIKKTQQVYAERKERVGHGPWVDVDLEQAGRQAGRQVQ